MKRLILTCCLLAATAAAHADTRLITRLDVLDVWQFNYNISHWLEQGNLRTGVSMYGEEPVAVTALSPELEGADWIQPAYGSKRFDRGDIAYFDLKADAEVFVAHNDAIAEKPAWLDSFVRTSLYIANDRGERFTCYRRPYRRGEHVTLGENGSSSHNMYLVAVRPLGEWPETVRPGGFVVDIAEAGAVGDGATVNTAVLQAAIDKCSARKGGGTVWVRDGIYVTGTLQLKSNVTLRVEAGAILRGSVNHDDFPPLRCSLPSFRGKEDFQMIYAEKASNITICGGGIIDGYSLFEGYPWRGRNNEHERPRLIRMVECENVAINGVTLARSANWTQYYEACRGMRVENVTVRCYTGTNNQDGIDLSGCSDVVVRNFLCSCGDDAICLKALSLTPAENIFVEDVRARYANCNLVKIGTETHGAIRNVHVRNAEGWTRYSIAIEAVDGSVIDGVTYEDIRMSNCAAPFVVRLGNRGRTFEGGPNPAPVGAIRNVTLRNIRNTGIGWVEVKGGPGVGTAVGGLKGHPIENVLIEDCDLLLFGSVNEPQMIYRDVPENEKKYPEFDCYGTCPAYGIYFRHVDGLQVRNVRLRLANNDVRPAIVMDDVKNYALEGIDYESCSRTEPYGLWHQQDGEIRDAKK